MATARKCPQISSGDISSSEAAYLRIVKKWKGDGKASYENLVDDNCFLGRKFLFLGSFQEVNLRKMVVAALCSAM